LIYKTLRDYGFLKENNPAAELNIIFDNCSGQNKNNTVLKLLLWLVEMGYFKRVNFVFLVVGHTKNSADRLFNALKLDYRNQNIYTIRELIKCLSRSKYCTIIPTVEEDFKNWNAYLDLFYRNYKDKAKSIIKRNHIFTCDYSQCFANNQLFVHVRESNLPRHVVSEIPMIKRGFYGRHGFEDGRYGLVDFAFDKKMPLKKAVEARPRIMKAAMEGELKQLEAPGINIYKQVELATKYKKIVPLDMWEDELYIRPDDDIISAVKMEKEKRKTFRAELNKEKKVVVKKVKSDKMKTD
jgi:hypothetical protein